MKDDYVTLSHLLLAIAAIAAVTVLAVAGKVDPTAAVLVITSSTGFSALGAVTSKSITNQAELPPTTSPLHTPPPAGPPPAGPTS